MESDAKLVKKVLLGDQTAFDVLVRRYERSVLSVITKILGDLHEAQDVTQETFIKAYQNLLSLKKFFTFGPWLMKIAQRQALTRARQRSRVKLYQISNDLSDCKNNNRMDRDSKYLLDAVMSLPDQERRVIMLRYFDGHSVSSIATITGRPVGTATKQLSRAYKRLRNILLEIGK